MGLLKKEEERGAAASLIEGGDLRNNKMRVEVQSIGNGKPTKIV